MMSIRFPEDSAIRRLRQVVIGGTSLLLATFHAPMTHIAGSVRSKTFITTNRSIPD